MEGSLTVHAEQGGRRALSALAAGWSEVQPTENVRRRGERLLNVHALRAAVGLQLAAALVWSGAAKSGAKLVCLDQNLREAALKEGFVLLPPRLSVSQ